MVLRRLPDDAGGVVPRPFARWRDSIASQGAGREDVDGLAQSAAR